MPVASVSILVLEPRPRWTPELQRQFLGEGVRVRQCTTMADLRRRAEYVAVVVLDLDAAPADVLQFLGRQAGRKRAMPIVTVGSPRTAELEWIVRDLGALEFLLDVCGGRRLARLCRRQFTLDGRKAAVSLTSQA